MGGFSGALGGLWVEISARIGAFDKAMDDVSGRLDEVDSKFQGISNIELGRNYAGLGVGLSAAVTAPILAIGVASVGAAAQMDSLIRGLTAVSGSSEAANTQLVKLKEVAKLPGLGFEEAVRGSINLQAAGYSATQADAALRGFGNALATVGKGKADLDGVILALSQIASKGKISAQEINQLAERVPQIRKIMEAAFGTADTEVLQKAGISAQEFVDKVTSELLKLPPVTGGIANTFENFRDSVNQSLVAIGNNLLPVVSRVIDGLSGLIGVAQSAAEWFGKLPAPVQNAALAFTLIVSAIGPFLVALGVAVSSFGTITTLFSSGALLSGLGLTAAGFTGVALAVPLVVAALVALGTWVYSNWDAVSTVVLQAWDGLGDLWHAAWDPIQDYLVGIWNAIAGFADAIWQPIVSFFKLIWSDIGPDMINIWNGIQTALTTVWTAIASAAATVWGGIVQVFQTFLEWAQKIPGVNKLMNLDEAWGAAKKLEDQTKKTAAAVKDHADAHQKGVSPVVKMAKAINTAGDNAKTTETKLRPLIDKSNELWQTAKIIGDEYRKHNEEVAKAKIALSALKDFIPSVTDG